MNTAKVILEFSLCVMKDIKSFLELFLKLGNMLKLLEKVAGSNILQANSSTSKLLKFTPTEPTNLLPESSADYYYYYYYHYYYYYY